MHLHRYKADDMRNDIGTVLPDSCSHTANVRLSLQPHTLLHGEPGRVRRLLRRLRWRGPRVRRRLPAPLPARRAPRQHLLRVRGGRRLRPALDPRGEAALAEGRLHGRALRAPVGASVLWWGGSNGLYGGLYEASLYPAPLQVGAQVTRLLVRGTLLPRAPPVHLPGSLALHLLGTRECRETPGGRHLR